MPADRRLLGLDRATIAPALVVAAFLVVMGFVLPSWNRAVGYDDIVRAGDVLEVRGGVTFVPEPGWGVTDGVRADDRPGSGTYPQQAVVVNGPVRFAVRTGTFEGTSQQLLDRIGRTTELLTDGEGAQIHGDPVPVTTRDGTRGVMARFSGPGSDGAVAAFAEEGLGVEVVITGPAEGATGQAEQAAAMLASLTTEGSR
ncbi:hypothetical protein [Nocardia sp. NPDC003345]